MQDKNTVELTLAKINVHTLAFISFCFKCLCSANSSKLQAHMNDSLSYTSSNITLVLVFWNSFELLNVFLSLSEKIVITIIHIQKKWKDRIAYIAIT